MERVSNPGSNERVFTLFENPGARTIYSENNYSLHSIKSISDK